jgi:hypothetical protein
MGIYKRLDDVPAEHRLERFAGHYRGRDIWNEWAVRATKRYTSDRYATHVERTERSWKDHLTARDRHHALARPSDVETWSSEILKRCQPLSAYQIYFTKLEPFFTWLLYHPGHPHCYHPVWMAADQQGPTATIWEAKLERSGD